MVNRNLIIAMALCMGLAKGFAYADGWTKDGLVVRLTTSGDTVGIGTTSPNTKVDVQGSMVVSFSSIGVLTGGLAPTFITHSEVGDYQQRLTWNPPSDTEPPGIWLEHLYNEGGGFYADGDIAVIYSGGDPDLFRVYDEDVLPNGEPELRLYGAYGGMLGLGLGSTNPSYRIDLPNNADASGQGRANAWVTYSSRRWKDDITPITGAIDTVKKLRGVRFKWKPTASRNLTLEEKQKGELEQPPQPPKPDIGFIAEEVHEILPEIVSMEANGIDASAMDYSRVVPVLVEAIKEQDVEMETMRATISQLGQKINP